MEEDKLKPIKSVAEEYAHFELEYAKKHYNRSTELNTYDNGYLDCIEEHIAHSFIMGAATMKDKTIAVLKNAIDEAFPESWGAVKESVKQTLISRLPKIYDDEKEGQRHYTSPVE